MAEHRPADADLRCLRWDVEGDRLLATLTPGGWDGLSAALDERAGLSLLARRLRRSGIKPPPSIAERLRAHGMALAVRTLQAQAQLAAAIAATGRPALLLKGADIADRLYGNLAHRPMGDIDFLVHPEDALAYHAHLLAAGFSASGAPDAEIQAASWQHHLFYAAPGGGMRLPFELHWRLSKGEHGEAIDLAGIWDRSLPHARFGTDARVMAPEDLFLYLCLHLRHHLFETPLTNIWDIAELIESETIRLDWPVVWERARAWQLEETVRITLHLVTSTLGVPTAHLSDWTPDPALARLLPNGLAMLGMYSPSLDFADRWLGQALAGDAGWRARGGALLRGLVPPRLLVRRQFGRPDQGLWGDALSYGRRFRAIWREKAKVILSWRNAPPESRSRHNRLVRLRHHFDGTPRGDGADGERERVLDDA